MLTNQQIVDVMEDFLETVDNFAYLAEDVPFEVEESLEDAIAEFQKTIRLLRDRVKLDS